MYRVVADTRDNEVVHLEDAEGVVAIGEEDVFHFPKRHRITPYPRSAVNPHHFLVEEQERRHHQILSKDSTIGTIVSRAYLTSRMGIHLQHAHGIGERLDTRKGATETMYSSTLRPDMLHR